MSTNGMNDLLMGTGIIGFAEAAAAVPFLFMTPNQTDPDMPPVKSIIKAIQSTLNMVSKAGLTVDGVMGPRTASALKSIVPQSLEVGTARWYELLQYARNAANVTARPDELSRQRPKGGNALGMSPAPVAGLSNPWVIGGAVALLILLSKKGRR